MNPDRKLMIAALLLSLLASGCGEFAVPTADASIRLPMGYLPSVQYAPFYVAEARGYFAEEGLDIEFDYAFETDGVALVAGGEIPFSLASGEQVLLARQEGLPVVYIMGWWQGYPVAVAALADSGINSPADLRGRRVGIPLLGGASYIGYAALLEANGLAVSDTRLDVIGFTQVEALRSGTVEAVVVYANNEPVVLESAGEEVRVFRVEDYVSLASNGMITNEVTLRENPELARRMIRATLRGLADTLDDPQAAFEICRIYVEGLSGETEAVQRRVLAESIRFWEAPRLGESSEEAWANMQQVMVDAGLLRAPLDLTDAFSNAYLP